MASSNTISGSSSGSGKRVTNPYPYPNPITNPTTVAPASVAVSLMSWCWDLALIIKAAFTCQVASFPRYGRVFVYSRIAEGGFAFVNKASKGPCNEKCAVKRVLCQDKEMERLVLEEIKALNLFKHRSVIPLLDHAVVRLHRGTVCMHLLFPLATMGSLRELINKFTDQGRYLSLHQILHVFVRVCEAVSHMHNHTTPYVHWDLKPENILFRDSYLEPWLTDFGSARPAALHTHTRAQALRVQEEAATYCTISFRAPELFDVREGVLINEKTDVWSLGCLLFAMRYGYSPFECEFRHDGRVRVVECSHLRVLSPVPKPPATMDVEQLVIQDLVNFILVREPSQRPSINDVISRIRALEVGRQV